MWPFDGIGKRKQDKVNRENARQERDRMWDMMLRADRILPSKITTLRQVRNLGRVVKVFYGARARVRYLERVHGL